MRKTAALDVIQTGRTLAAAALLWPLCGLAAEPQLPPLTTVSRSPRLPGKFVWADLVTDDVPAARKFYAQLFGWTFRDWGSYSIGANEERPLCGMFQLARPKDRPAGPRWFAYISVNDVERAQRVVTRAGGQVLAPPRSLPKRGEQAVFADPEGAVFGVVKSSSGDPEDFLAEPGDWIWIQLMSREAAKAGEFYRAVADYQVVENTTSARAGDYVFVSKRYARAAALTLPTGATELRPSWLLFVRVKSVSDCVAQAARLGGKVLLPPNPQLLNGKVAVLADPTGAAIGVMEWDGLVKGG